MYEALDADRNGGRALDIARNSALAEGRPLALNLRFPPEAVELASLPWELLWDDQPTPLLLSDGHLALCTRHLNLSKALPPPATQKLPLRLLVIAPRSDIPDNVREAERSARVETLQPLIDRDELVVVAEVSPATRAAVVDAVQQHKPDIVHYYGHGRYFEGVGSLLLDAPGGGRAWTAVDRLMTLLKGVRLVVLYACQGAAVSEHGLLTGIAPALSSAGVPIVIAMQHSIRISAATRMSRILYRELARGTSVQDAVNMARQSLYIEEDEQVSWFVPTIYIRASDTGPVYLIEPKSMAQSVELPTETDPVSPERRHDIELFTYLPVGTTANQPQTIDWSRFFTTRPKADDVWQSIMLPDLVELRRELGRNRIQRIMLYPRLHNGFGLGVGAYFARAFRLTVEQPFPNTGVQVWASDEPPARDIFIVTDPEDLDVWLDQLTLAPVSIEISISRDVHAGVDNHIQNLANDVPWQRLTICPSRGPSFGAVPDNASAAAYANQIGDIIRRVRDRRPGLLIHLFASMPLGLEILLGLQLNACKPLQCYGYDNNLGAYYEAYTLK